MAEPRSLRGRRRNEKLPGTGKFWLGLARWIFYPLTMLLSTVRVRGHERIPEDGPALIVLNHVSHLDPVFDAVMVHRSGRVPRFMAKNSLWNVPVLKNVLSGTGQIPVYRGTADAQKALQAGHDGLKTGKAIVIYPDGTITKDPEGWPMTPKPGIARLALTHDIPVIPAARWGTRDIYDHYNKKFRPFPRKTVNYVFGEPLDLSAYRSDNPDAEALRAVSRLAMTKVRDLLGELRDEKPPTEFYSPARKPKGDDGGV